MPGKNTWRSVTKCMTSKNNDSRPVCIIVRAESVQDGDGDEQREWYVAHADEQLDPIGNISNFHGNEKSAKDFANSLGNSRRVPVEYVD